MADLLPMFPLGLIAFPGESVNLHIFEPRYKQLIHECHHGGITFGLLPYFEGQEMTYATEMTLLDIAKTYPDGKMDVRTKAVRRVKVVQFYNNHPGKLYPGAEIESTPWDQDADVELSMQITGLIHQLYDVMSIDNVPVADPVEFRTYQNIHKLGLSDEDELKLLGMAAEVDRQKYILAHLHSFVPMMKEAAELRRKAALNGHFKNLKPRL